MSMQVINSIKLQYETVAFDNGSVSITFEYKDVAEIMPILFEGVQQGVINSVSHTGDCVFRIIVPAINIMYIDKISITLSVF